MELTMHDALAMPWLMSALGPKADILGALPPESIPVKANALFGQYGIARLRAV